MNQETDTRTRIINAANELFARMGYNGASIRDIASEAGVNVAAINYHFGNKQSLYWEIYLQAHLRLTEGMKQIAADQPSVAELCWRTYQLLESNIKMLRNIFKLFLSESIPEPDGQYKAACQGHTFGPPGSEVILEAIHRELGETLPRKAQFWAVKTIFSNLVHSALMAHTKYVQTMADVCQSRKLMDSMEKSLIVDHVQAILEYLSRHKGKWVD